MPPTPVRPSPCIHAIATDIAGHYFAEHLEPCSASLTLPHGRARAAAVEFVYRPRLHLFDLASAPSSSWSPRRHLLLPYDIIADHNNRSLLDSIHDMEPPEP